MDLRGEIYLGFSLFLKGLPRTSRYDVYKARTIGGALAYPSSKYFPSGSIWNCRVINVDLVANMPTNVWELDIHTRLPPLPDEPPDITNIPNPFSVKSDEARNKQALPIYDSGYDDYSEEDDIWSSLRYEDDSFKVWLLLFFLHPSLLCINLPVPAKSPLRSWEMLGADYVPRATSHRHILSPYLTEATFDVFNAVYEK